MAETSARVIRVLLPVAAATTVVFSAAGIAAANPVPPPANCTTAVVKPPRHDQCVAYLQVDLNEKGNIHVDPNGDFNQPTTNAVKAFQRSRGLPADGIVGPQTWRELGPA